MGRYQWLTCPRTVIVLQNHLSCFWRDLFLFWNFSVTWFNNLRIYQLVGFTVILVLCLSPNISLYQDGLLIGSVKTINWILFDMNSISLLSRLILAFLQSYIKIVSNVCIYILCVCVWPFFSWGYIILLISDHFSFYFWLKIFSLYLLELRIIGQPDHNLNL